MVIHKVQIYLLNLTWNLVSYENVPFIQPTPVAALVYWDIRQIFFRQLTIVSVLIHTQYMYLCIHKLAAKGLEPFGAVHGNPLGDDHCGGPSGVHGRRHEGLVVVHHVHRQIGGRRHACWPKQTFSLDVDSSFFIDFLLARPTVHFAGFDVVYVNSKVYGTPQLIL